MKTTYLAGATAVFAAAGMASAQITPVGPFTGPNTEGFETQNPPCPPCFFNCIPGRIFNNTADACDSTGSGMDVTSGWQFMCTIFPHAGSEFTASAGGPVRITFDVPVAEFGGYFGTNSGTDGAVVTFSDSSNSVIGMANMTTAGCTWTWNGWQSTTPIKSLLITGNNPFGGGFMDMDDLEYMPGGTPPPSCYANCDGSTSPPILNVSDFGCFLNKFNAGDTYANCDGSTSPPVLNVADFGCFLNKFNAGCS